MRTVSASGKHWMLFLLYTNVWVEVSSVLCPRLEQQCFIHLRSADIGFLQKGACIRRNNCRFTLLSFLGARTALCLAFFLCLGVSNSERYVNVIVPSPIQQCVLLILALPCKSSREASSKTGKCLFRWLGCIQEVTDIQYLQDSANVLHACCTQTCYLLYCTTA